MSEEIRQIYIGDMIQLTVDSSYASEKEIMDAFSQLEVVAIVDQGKLYEVTLRSFEPGSYKVDLAGQALEIVVASTLENIERETLYEPGSLPPAGMTLPYGSLMVVMVAVVFIASLWLAVLRFIGKKEKVVTAYDSFNERVLSVENTPLGLSLLTSAFKAYLSDSGILQMTGPTSHEIIESLNQSRLSDNQINEVTDCLRSSDAVHYMPEKPSSETITEIIDRIKKLSESIRALEVEDIS